MMSEVTDLEMQLAAAKKREKHQQTRCKSCAGKGFFSDTTYDRCGSDTQCGKCHGTGLPEDKVASIIKDAFVTYRKYTAPTVT
ncbi:hypothetical protein KAU11_10875 [Candidatus Babeliales bacterium]|nr:hypothetical protein [Candidatus Babeliales bacterium]